MSELKSKISNWYWAYVVALCGLLVLWLVENPEESRTILFFFYSPLFLVLLGVVSALRQGQLETFAHGPAVWLIITTVLFSALQIVQPVSMTAVAFSFLYVTFALAGLSYTGRLWLKEQSHQHAVP